MSYKDSEARRLAHNKCRKARREMKRLWLRNYLADNPCIDCGESDPIVLEFDHQGDKSFTIGAVASVSPAFNRLIAEVAKCQVRCANCHRKKTYKELGHTHKD